MSGLPDSNGRGDRSAAAAPAADTLLDALPELIATVHGDRIVSLNRSGAAILGLAKAEEAIGAPLTSFLDARTLHAVLLHRQQAGDDPKAVWLDTQMKRADGAAINAMVRAVPMAGSGNLAIIARAADPGAVLAQEQSAAAHAAEGMKQLIANMAHELRTPLNAIIGFSEIIAGRMFGDIHERYAVYAEDIVASGQHLLRIINDILDYANIESGEMLFRPERVALGDVVHASTRLVMRQAERDGVDLKTQVPDDLPPVEADATKLKQIVINLLSNAIRFTPRGGNVVVGAKPENGRIWVWVQDTGLGMTREEVAEAILPFRQPKRPLHGAYTGTGLGLPIAKALAGLHGSELYIDSMPGNGTTVRFTLPRH